MNAITESILKEAADAFTFDRTTGEISRYGEGHINDTFVVWASDKCKRYIMQRINTDTFKNPKELMENVCNVTSFLRKVILENGGDPERETLNVIPTKDGKPFYTDSDGGTWRAYSFVEDTVCLQKVENENDFYTVAETFGTFQNQLAAFPAATLHETIIKFHDTPTRYQNFEKAVAEDAMGRAKDVADEIAFVRSREADCHVLVDMLSKNEIPLRVTHNDTKLNNVLIDKTSKKGVCVIDLDTVMPGLAAYDFGDSIRFGDGFAMFDGAELIKDYVSEDYLVMSTYAMIFDGADAAGLPHLSSANSPLAAYPGYLLNYEQPYGAGRITIL